MKEEKDKEGKYNFRFSQTFSDSMLAICDREIVEETLYTSRGVPVKASSFFYGKEVINEDKAKKLLKMSGNINLMGNEIVKVAIDVGIVHEKSVIWLKRKKAIEDVDADAADDLIAHAMHIQM